MAFFSFSIVTDANTAATAMKHTVITLSPGVIHRVRVRIPPGQKGVCHCFINHHLHQLWPVNAGEDFHGDDESIDFQEFYEMGGLDTKLDVYTWNTSENYEHEMILQFGILPRYIVAPFLVAQKIKKAFEGLLGKTKEVED